MSRSLRFKIAQRRIDPELAARPSYRLFDPDGRALSRMKLEGSRMNWMSSALGSFRNLTGNSVRKMSGQRWTSSISPARRAEEGD